MPWTETARREYRRDNDRYASDLTDQEWRLLEPFMPPANKHSRPRTTDLREIMNAILYLVSAGCAWALLPKDLPPRSTVQRYFYQWRDCGLLQTIRFHLAKETRELEGREASPGAVLLIANRSKPQNLAGCRAMVPVKRSKGGSVISSSTPSG